MMAKNIHQEIVFNASPQDIYEAYMNAKQHSEYTAATAEINREAGGAFSCHGGRITGRFIELIPHQRIVQAWRVNDDWEDGVYSIVKIELKSEGDKTRPILDHAGVPEGKHDHIDTGWHKRYWEPLQQYLARKL